MCRIDNIRGKYNGQTKLYDFYKEAFPTDKDGLKDINRNATFQDAFECLQTGFNFYAFLGVDDSIVRERIFDALATLMGCSYDHVYYQWLNHSQEPFGLQMVTDTAFKRSAWKKAGIALLTFLLGVALSKPGGIDYETNSLHHYRK